MPSYQFYSGTKIIVRPSRSWTSCVSCVSSLRRQRGNHLSARWVSVPFRYIRYKNPRNINFTRIIRYLFHFNSFHGTFSHFPLPLFNLFFSTLCIRTLAPVLFVHHTWISALVVRVFIERLVWASLKSLVKAAGFHLGKLSSGQES